MLAFLPFFLKSQVSAQVIPAAPWCQTTKAMIAKAIKDPRSIAGNQLDSTAYSVKFLSKLPITGADSVRVFFYPDGGRLDRVVAYYGDKATRKQYDQTYQSLVSNLKSCYKTTTVMDHAYEQGYDKAVFFTKSDEYYQVLVATESKALVERFKGVVVVIRMF